jgi:DMSO/TMAO reductase YedYZ molybdopterin-dependent catalytic subunit
MEYNEKMLAAKEKLLARFKERGQAPRQVAAEERLPPGQHLTSGFPVLDLGVRPLFHPKRWRFSIEGEVEAPLDVNWEEFIGLGAKSLRRADFHCVTTWSKYDVDWGGISLVRLLALVQPKETARYLIVHCADGYSTNLPLSACLEDDVLLAYELAGEPLPRQHGGPMRLVVPKLYAWKSAKFVKKLVLTAQDEPGFWEQRGYHNHGDPWREERHA